MTSNPLPYHYPPRPTNASPPDMLDLYERDGWIAQAKFDGTCAIFTVHPTQGILAAMSRHGPDAPLKRWRPTPAHEEALKRFCGIGTNHTCIFVAELMDGRVPLPHLAATPLVIHDVLHFDGQPLVGWTYFDRYSLIKGLALVYGTRASELSHTVLDDSLWLATFEPRNLRQYYDDLFAARATHPELEGIVIKNPHSRLKPCIHSSANEAGQIKIRFPTDKDGIHRRSF